MPGFVCRWAFLEFPALLHPEPSRTGDLIPEPPFSSGTPTPTCWGCSSAGMAFTRRWALPSSAAAPNLNLASTRCASSRVPGGRKYRTCVCIRLSVLWPWSQQCPPDPDQQQGQTLSPAQLWGIAGGEGWGWSSAGMGMLRAFWRCDCGAQGWSSTGVRTPRAPQRCDCGVPGWSKAMTQAVSPQMSPEPGQLQPQHPDLPLDQNHLRQWQEIHRHRLCDLALRLGGEG